MAKAEFGTPKFLSNQMKARGLQKLKWYCQICEKQCRDDNGFKCHVRSESHLRKIKTVDSKVIHDFSAQFKNQFITDLKNYHGEKWINANKFYNQLIQQKDHIHLNSTKWSSVSRFIQDMSKQGVIQAKFSDESGEDTSLNGIEIAYINNSGDEIIRKVLLKKKNAFEENEEQIGTKLLQEQIKRGKLEAEKAKEEEAESIDDDTVVKSDDTVVKSDKPIKIQLKKPIVKANAFKITKPNPLKVKVNPLKVKSNPLKTTK